MTPLTSFQRRQQGKQIKYYWISVMFYKASNKRIMRIQENGREDGKLLKERRIMYDFQLKYISALSHD